MSATIDKQRFFLNTVFYACGIVYWIYLFWCDALLHQMEAPVLVNPRFDYTYWMLLIAQIPQTLTHVNVLAWGFDVLWLVMIVGAFIFPHRLWFHRINLVLAFLHFCIYNIYGGAHYTNVAFMLMSAIFVTSNPKTFQFFTEGMRYYVLFIFVSAAFWKLGKGSLWQEAHFAGILRFQVLDTLVARPDYWVNELRLWVIMHPMVAQVLWGILIAVQLSFAVGFFTKRWDGWLILLGISFHVGSTLLANIPNWEFVVLYALFLPWARWPNQAPTKLTPAPQ